MSRSVTQARQTRGQILTTPGARSPCEVGVHRQQGGSVNRRIVKLAAVTFVAGALAMSGCGSRADTGSSSSTGATNTAKIGVIAPLSGDLSALGLGIKNSVDLAIK